VERIQQVPTIWKAWKLVLDGAGNQTRQQAKRDVEFVVTKLDFFWCVFFIFLNKQFSPSCETPKHIFGMWVV
jgi:hypothetical protein